MRATISLANMKISAVDGTAFFDTGVADILTDHIGEKLYIRDSAGATIWGWIKAAGTGETLGSEKFLNSDFSTWTGDDPDSWTVVNEDANNYITEAATGARVVSDNTSPVNMYQSVFSLTVGALYKQEIAVTVDTLNWREKFEMPGGTLLRAAGNYTGTSKIYYYTQTAAGIVQFFFRSTDGSCDYTVTLCSYKQVTAPTTTGVTIVSTKGGTIYNWASKDAGFNYDDASGYEISTYGFQAVDGIDADNLAAVNGIPKDSIARIVNI